MMKIDKKQSLKNEIGVIAFSSLLALSFTPLTANAEQNNISVDYTDYYSRTGHHEIVVIQRENEEDQILPKDEFDMIMNYPDDGIIEINGVNYSKQELQNALEDNTNRKQTNFDQALILGSIPLIGGAVTVVVFGIHEYKKKTINRKDHNGFVRHIR